MSVINSTIFPNNHRSFYFDFSLTPFIIIIAILSPVAVVENILVLAAIWKNPLLRTPSYWLLGALVLTDFFSGLIAQPLFVVTLLTRTPRVRKTTYACYAVFSSYCLAANLLTVTFMSIERWLHMTGRSLASLRYFYPVLIVLAVVPTPLVVANIIHVVKTGFSRHSMDDVFHILTTICLIAGSVAYFKVYKIIRNHQRKVQGNDTTAQNFGQPSINLMKYKKSVFTILYILLLFYLSYLPLVINFASERLGIVQSYSPFYFISVVILYSSSSLNPLLYYWRMKDIRDGITQILKKLSC